MQSPLIQVLPCRMYKDVLLSAFSNKTHKILTIRSFAVNTKFRQGRRAAPTAGSRITSKLQRDKEQTKRNQRREQAANRRKALSVQRGRKLAPFVTNDGSDEDEVKMAAFVSKSEPWKHLFGTSARAAWRVSETRPSTELEEAQKYVLEIDGYKRSHKVLRRTLEDVMKSHHALAERRTRERNTLLKIFNRNKSQLQQDRQRDARTLPVLYGPNEVFTSFKFRLIPNYDVVKRVLEECNSLLGVDSFQPKKVIDFGIGCGSASTAALDVWPDIEWIHGIDPSLAMREGAEMLLTKYIRLHENEESEQGKTTRITTSAYLSAETSSTTYDLALFAYTATEFQYNDATLAAAALLWEKLSPNGVFVMIEPGTPDGFMSVRTVRNMLLDCHRHDDADDGSDENEDKFTENVFDTCHIIAPCTHNGLCPLDPYNRPLSTTDKASAFDDSHDEDHESELDDDDYENETEEHEEESDDKTIDYQLDPEVDIDADADSNTNETAQKGFCSFVQRMPGKSGLGKGEKFSYLVAQKRTVEQGQANKDSSVISLLHESLVNDRNTRESIFNQALDLASSYCDSDKDDLGLELVSESKESFGRIVNAPIKRKGLVIIDSCESPGRVVRYNITKRKLRSTPGLYAAARVARWGGYWPSLISEKD